MRVLSAALGLLVLVPPATGLAGLTHDERTQTLRVHVEGDAVRARAIEGTPSLQGQPLSGNWTALEEVEIEPWRGYERTAQLRYGANGTILLADGESGLWLQPNASSSSDRGGDASEEGNQAQGNHTKDSGNQPEGSGREPADRGSADDDRADTRRSTRPTDEGDTAPAGDPERRAMQEDPLEDSDSEDSEDAADPSLLPWVGLVLAIAVGVGPWALDLARKRLRRIDWPQGGGDEEPASEGQPEDSDDARYPWLSPGSGGRGLR